MKRSTSSESFNDPEVGNGEAAEVSTAALTADAAGAEAEYLLTGAWL
jgi:hypothetical protein